MPTVEYLNLRTLVEHEWSLDDDPFEKARAASISKENYGVLELGSDDYILSSAESEGFDWPYSCRHGQCANCAALLIDGEIEMASHRILTDEEVEEKDIRLTCIGTPASDHVRIIYNARHLPFLREKIAGV